MNPTPYFIRDPRNGQVRIRQNHLKGRQIIKVPNEIAEGWNKKKGLPRDSEQAARLQNLITRLERGSKRLAAKGYPNAPLRDVWDEIHAPEDEGAPTSNRIADWCTWRASLSGIHYKRGFLNIKYHLTEWGRPDALLVNITESWVIGYCKFLDGRGLKAATIKKQVGYLRQVIQSARANNQPTGEIPVKLNKSLLGGKPSEIRQGLNFEELLKLKDLERLPKHQEVIRDMFLLMAFTGVRIGDLLQPNWKITHDRIINSQSKTGGVHVITLNKYSKEIIAKYSTVRITGEFKLDFPAHEGQYLNREYKKLASLAGIGKNITNHIARHSFAMALADIGLNEGLRAKELGHRQSVTGGYGTVSADEQVRRVSQRWESALSKWEGDYIKWVDAVNF